MKTNTIASIVVSMLFTSAAAAAQAATRPDAPYPSRPVRLLMGPAAGGPTDAVGRVLAARLNEMWSQPVIVENRPGAGNTIATAASAKATPDGYSLLFCPVSDAVAPALYKKLPYDFAKEIMPIAHVGATPNIFVVPPSSPAKNVKEFIAYAKANPGKLNYGGQGIGQSGHLSMELLRMMTGIDVVYIPYKSVGLVVTDLLAGRMDAQITNLPAHVENVRNGKLRALGVTSAKRSPRLPEVPAIAETVPGFELMVWYGLCAPAGVAKPVVDRIAADVLAGAEDARGAQAHGGAGCRRRIHAAGAVCCVHQIGDGEVGEGGQGGGDRAAVIPSGSSAVNAKEGNQGFPASGRRRWTPKRETKVSLPPAGGGGRQRGKPRFPSLDLLSF